MVKFSDDTTILSFLKSNSSITKHKAGIDWFVDCCDDYYWYINVQKTEQVIKDSRTVGDRSSVVIHSHDIKHVNSNKYVGGPLTASWTGTQMWQVSAPEFTSDYTSFADSGFLVFAEISYLFFTVPLLNLVFLYTITCWFGNSIDKCKTQSSFWQKNSMKNHGNNYPLPQPSHFWTVHLPIHYANRILSDPSHVL